MSPTGAARRWSQPSRPVAVVALAALVGALHAAAIAPWYSLGSFDDDAGYVLGARALLSGSGLAGHTAAGTVVAGSYPPGYPALMTPLLWIWPHSAAPLRLLSFACFLALFPLTWRWLGNRGVADGPRAAVLALLALNPVAATYGSMVMAEMPLLVVLLVLLLALDRDDVVTVAVAAVALVWLKEAAAALDAGVVVWFALRKRWGKAAVVAAAVGGSLAPVLAARVAAGLPLAGSRYSQELGTYYTGGLVGRVLHVVPSGVHAYLSSALPASVVPRGAPLWGLGTGATLLRVVGWHVSILTLVGAVLWIRRHRDPAGVLVPIYVLETLLWPYVNERRVVLVLPVVLAWYVTGAVAAGGALLDWRPRLRPAVAASVVVVVVVPLLAQAPRDYLYDMFQHGSRPGRSRGLALLAALEPGPVVETDYPSSVALFSHHRTARAAFLANDPLAPDLHCVDPGVDLRDATADGAAWVVTGELNKPGVTDNPCVLAAASGAPWAVRLLRSSLDALSVFELIGPGSTQPRTHDRVLDATVSTGAGPAGTRDLAPQAPADVAGSAPYVRSSGGTGTLVWDWHTPVAVRQVSVGGVKSLDGATTGVRVEIDGPGGWRPVASAPGAVGDAPGAAPYLLARLPPGTLASALRIEVRGPGRLVAVDVHALGEDG